MNIKIEGLILASESLAREELLKNSGIQFTKIEASNIDETRHSSEKPKQYALRVASAKAISVSKINPNYAVLAADTVVSRGISIMHKTNDINEARKILKSLAGKKHSVITAVVLALPNQKCLSKVVESRISIKKMEPEEIESYLKTKEWMGKSGCFSLAGLAARFIISITGSPSGIIGIPIYETYHLLKGAGLTSYIKLTG